MRKLNPKVIDVNKVKPLELGGVYLSRMILDDEVTGRDGIMQINHGTVKPEVKLGGDLHDQDEIYYILSGKGKLKLGDDMIDLYPDQIIFIPAGVFHAIDNSESDEEMKILTFWKEASFNETYVKRMELWGKSFKTIDEE